MPGQKPEAVEHDRAMETGKMDARHLAWEEGMPDSLERCVFLFFFFYPLSLFMSPLGRCWAGIPEKERVQDSK